MAEISRSDAGASNLRQTAGTLERIIDRCKKDHAKAICFVTGVPGAGKTLAGLNIANQRHTFAEDEHAVFLSGNGPLVSVLRFSGPIGMTTPLKPGLTLTAAAGAIEKAFSMRGAKAVAIQINSPGGSAVQSTLIYKRLRAVAEEKDLKVYVFAEDVAASGVTVSKVDLSVFKEAVSGVYSKLDLEKEVATVKAVLAK